MKFSLLVGGELIAYLKKNARPLWENPTYRAFLNHLLQTRRGDGGLDFYWEEKGWPATGHTRAVFYYKETARCAGKLKQGLQRNFPVTGLLMEFVEELHQLGWAARFIKHDYVDGRAAVVEVEWPPALLEAWEAGERRRRGEDRGGLFFLASGEPYSKPTMERMAARDKMDRRQIHVSDLDEETTPAAPSSVIAYHAKFDPLHLDRLRGRAAPVLARALQDAEHARGRARERALCAANRLTAYLEETEDGSPVGLRRVPNSDRVYPDGSSLLNVPREYRDEVFKGMGAISLDLKAAQLACLAVIYRCPELHAQLRSKDNWWTVILRHMFPLTSRPEAKGAVKGATYGGGYGERKSKTLGKMRTAFREQGIPPAEATSGVDEWISHPLTRALYAARDLTFAQIRREGGMTTPLGAWIACTARNRPRQVAAQAAQAVEQAIINAVYAVAEKVGFWILQNRFDGLIILPYPGVDPWDAIEAATAAVREVAQRLDVPTELEAAGVAGEALPPPPLPFRALERLLLARAAAQAPPIDLHVVRRRPHMAYRAEEGEGGAGGGEGREGQGWGEHVSYFHSSSAVRCSGALTGRWVRPAHLARAVRETRAGPCLNSLSCMCL